jgi:hypothetical protein
MLQQLMMMMMNLVSSLSLLLGQQFFSAEQFFTFVVFTVFSCECKQSGGGVDTELGVWMV